MSVYLVFLQGHGDQSVRVFSTSYLAERYRDCMEDEGYLVYILVRDLEQK